VKQWIAITALLLAAGCKQGNGQRCQVDSDCASNMCSSAEPKVCIGGTDNTADIDATPDSPIDAPVDAGADAAVDGAIDAPGA
jgi:hypothetical protein